MMDMYFVKLLDIMNQETKLFEEINKIAEYKKSVIMDNNIQELENITKKEAGFTKAVMSLEKSKEDAIFNLCKDRDIDLVDNISELMSILNDVEKNQFNIIRNSYVKSIDTFKKINDLNQALLLQTLDYINLKIDTANSIDKQDIGYDTNASEREVRIRKNLFDYKV